MEKQGTHLIVALGLVIAIIVLAINTKAPDVNIGNIQDLKDTLSVSGSGKVTVEPDKAEVYIRILTESADAKTAQEDNAEISNDVRTALMNKGVMKKDMETSSYSLYPKTSYDRNSGESQIYGYSVNHILKVETTDTENTGDLIDSAVSAGANGLDRVSFLLSDSLRDSAYMDALEEASANAKGKAMSITSALGVDLGEITSVSESGAIYTPFRIAGAKAMYDESEDMTVPTVIFAQDIEVSANVGVVYAIE